MTISETTAERISKMKQLFPFELCEMGTTYSTSFDAFNISDAIHNIFPDAEVYFGASKVAIVFNDNEPVIKMPLYGSLFPMEQVDEEDLEPDSIRVNRDYYIVPFQYSGGYENGWNYCENEVDCFTKHDNEGYSFFFAETEPCGNTLKGVPLYIQEKVISVYEADDANSLPLSSRHSLREVQNRNYARSNPYAIDNPDQEVDWNNWLAIAVDIYSENIVDSFVDYISGQSFMQDMHRKNYGFRANGTPCILDYSGYYE